MINKMLIGQRLDFILEYHNQLTKFAEKTREEFLADKTLIAATESYLRRILESVFDIGRHILAKSERIASAIRAGKMVSSLYKGPYQECVPVYEALNKWIEAKGEKVGVVPVQKRRSLLWRGVFCPLIELN